MKIGMPADNPHPLDLADESSLDDDIVWTFDAHHSLDVIIADDRWAAYITNDLKSDVAQLVSFVSALIEGQGFHVCLRWTNNAEMQALNAQFREKDKATNVLSFPNDFPFDEGDVIALGDAAFGFETMMSESQQMGITIDQHIRHLIIHALLHLAGFDHEEDEDATEMEGLEIAALAVIGVDNPYQEAPFEDVVL